MKETKLEASNLLLPHEITSRFCGYSFHDCTSSENSRTIRIFKHGTSVFLKIGDPKLLQREIEMYRFFSIHSLCPTVLDTFSDGETSYLLLSGLEGEDGISPANLSRPAELAAVFGEGLKKIHSISPIHAPFQSRSIEMEKLAEDNLRMGIFGAYLMPEGLSEGIRKLKSSKYTLRSDTVVHGDYCLPNVIFHNMEISGFIDLGNGGISDRHYDIFWGLWTLEHNLGTTNYNHIFLDSYGRKEIDEEGIEYCRLLSAFMN